MPRSGECRQRGPSATPGRNGTEVSVPSEGVGGKNPKQLCLHRFKVQVFLKCVAALLRVIWPR